MKHLLQRVMLFPLRLGPWDAAVKALRFAGLVPAKAKSKPSTQIGY
jgi:hypothetical protein